MLQMIPIGTTFTAETVVSIENTADAMQSGAVKVFATPSMIALMEQAAFRSLLPYLKPGQASVGTKVNVNHSKGSLVGTPVTATAVVTLVDRRRVEFDVQASTLEGEIGRGTHTRFIIEEKDFLASLK